MKSLKLALEVCVMILIIPFVVIGGVILDVIIFLMLFTIEFVMFLHNVIHRSGGEEE